MKYRISSTGNGKSIFILLTLISAFVFSGCSALPFFDFDSPKVLTSFPVNGHSYISTNDVQGIEFTFSKKMNQQSVEKAFLLQKLIVENTDEENIAGYFTWKAKNDRDKVTFTPYLPFTFGKYRITLLNSAEDSAGNDLKDDIVIVFMIGTNQNIPDITYLFPDNNSTNLPSTNLIITVVFSEPLNVSALNTMFSITPSLNYQIVPLSNNAFFELRPLEAYNPGKYSLIINNIEDLSGNKMPSSRTYYFTIGNDFYPPQFTGIYTDANFTAPALQLTNGLNLIDKTGDLYFTFSENIKMDPDNIPISFEPSITGTWQTNSNFVMFHPIDFWEIQKVYTISINDGFSDLAGKTTKTSYKSYAKISSPASYFIDITGIICLTNSAAPSQVWTAFDINEISNTSTISVQCTFNSTVIPTTFLDGVSLSIVSGLGSRSTSISGIEISTNTLPDDTYNIKIISNSLNLYRLTIKGGRDGIRDSYNNWLSNDVNIYYILR